MSDVLLDALDDASTDKELFDAASAIVAVPKVPGKEFSDASFILHAPLEICARYFLLPLVEDEYVQQARKQIRLTAKKYFEYENADLPSHSESASYSAPASHSEASAEESPRSGESEILHSVQDDVMNIDIPQWSTSLLFASHAPILLALQNVLGETNTSVHSVLNRMNKEIIRNHDAQMRWAKSTPVQQDISADLLEHPQHWFVENVGNINRVEGGDGPIRTSVERVEAAGMIEPLIEILGSIANFSERANFEIPFQSLMRVSAFSMIAESEEHAKYGWTHCLTIPHAMWVLSAQSQSSGRLLQAATTHAATFRALLCEQKLSVDNLEEYFEPDEHAVFAEHYVRITDIISEACAMEDAHLVKYTYSCFDCMKRDPRYSKLYIAAAGKLLALWQEDSSSS